MNREIVNLCPQCKYISKCKRIHPIHESLTEIVMDALEDWEIDLDIKFSVSDCKRYTPYMKNV